jgi:exodeoxyribonuclease V alpha subunit
MTADLPTTSRQDHPSSPPGEGDLVVLDGVIDRITYVNEENGYTVARLKVPRQKQLTTIAGFMPAITVGEGLRLEGHWQNHPQYGRQLMVVHYQSAAPGTLASLKKYLGSGLLKGVGPTMAEHIVNTFGLETLHVLDVEPHRLVEVPGLGAKRAQTIAATWAERRALRDLMSFLQSYGLPVALAVRILRKYGTAAEAIVREQPYRLAAEVYGISFEVADSMAAKAGVPRDAQQRIGAGIATVLGQGASGGHVYLPVEGLVTRAAALLSLPRDTLVESLPRLVDAGVIRLEHPVGVAAPVAYLTELHSAEQAVAEALVRLQFGRDRLGGTRQQDWDTVWAYLSRADEFELTREQREAVRVALTHRVSVITGGPGTGKTTTLRSIVRLVQTRGGTVVLAAPTGRAARRLTEAAGAPASTIHKLLELRPGGAYEVRAPLDADLVIIDEASMMDLQLAAALLGAVPSGSHLVLVGDADQLPPVGPGSVLRDVIDSHTVPVCRLQTIFRQPEGSAIVSNAHRINHGENPVYGRMINDFYLFREPNPAAAAALVVDLVSERVPAKFGLDPLEDIQVLAPMYAGVCGVDALNANLQAILNPPDTLKDERRYGNHIFRVGDRVMQIVNDYDRQVANGEVGRITRIDLEDQTLHVAFESGWTAEYSFQELDELTHAYAISVHKAQGSEYPCVIMPVLHQHERMLRRNLVYTAISRARQLVVLVGSPDALSDAVANDLGRKRHSGLVARLREAST